MSEQPIDEKGVHRTLGGWMIALAWLIVLGLFTLFFSGVLEKQRNPNQDVVSRSGNGVKEVVLQQNRQGHYLATGSINGKKVNFLLDTGATAVSVPAHLARRLQLQYGPSRQVMTANGTISVYATRLDEVALGNITLNNIRANINPHVSGDDILLGMSFLRQLEFTQRDGQLILKQHF